MYDLKLGKVKRGQNGTLTQSQVCEQILKIPNDVDVDRYKNHLWIFQLMANPRRSKRRLV